MTKDEQIRTLRQAAREVLDELPEDMGGFTNEQVKALDHLYEATTKTGRRTTEAIPSWVKKEGA